MPRFVYALLFDDAEGPAPDSPPSAPRASPRSWSNRSRVRRGVRRLPLGRIMAPSALRIVGWVAGRMTKALAAVPLAAREAHAPM